jgi:hypothetical protein
MVEAGESFVLEFRLSNEILSEPFAGSDVLIRQRREETDEFYETVYAPGTDAQEKEIQRRALSGMLWSKQTYLFDVNRWL